jgi:hypothetical protein
MLGSNCIKTVTYKCSTVSAKLAVQGTYVLDTYLTFNIINHYCLKHYNQSLQHQRGMEQPQSTNPVDGHIIVSASSSIWQDELHLNQATVQPCSKNPIDATTDNNGINGNVFKPSISVWHEELIGAQATMELDSGASVEPFPSLIEERLLHVALINNSPTTPI